MRKALIIDNQVREVLIAEPFPPFHPALQWVPCDSGVQPGWTYVGGIFSAPPELDPAAVARQDALSQVRELESRQARAIRESVLSGEHTRLLEIEKRISVLMGRAPVA